MSLLANGSVLVERTFNAAPDKVFGAIAEGVLFRRCGAEAQTMKIDFRVGGKYEWACPPHPTVSGEFTEIVPAKKIAFTWSSGGRVAITLTAKGNSTHMSLAHTDINDAEAAGDFNGGWTNGFDELTTDFGRTIKISREFSAPVAKVFEAFKNPLLFLNCGAEVPGKKLDFKEGVKFNFKSGGCSDEKSADGAHPGGDHFLKGEFTSIYNNSRIAFTWDSGTAADSTGETLVMVDFEDLKNGKTRVDIIHAGFKTEQAAKQHEGGWSQILPTYDNLNG